MPAEQQGGLDVLGLLRLIWGNRVLVGGLTLLGTVAAIVISFVMSETYRAEVVIAEADRNGLGGSASLLGQIGGLANLAGVNIGEDASNREAKAVLRSHRLAEEFIRRNELLPTLFPQPSASKPATLWRGVRRFKSSMLNVREDSRTNLITISMNARTAKDAARWANGYVALANELLRTRAIDEASRNVAFLDEQITKTSVVELQRVMYRLIENETKTLMLANARPDYAFTVVDPAVVPELRVSPRRTLITLFGLVLGFALGVATALVRRAYRNDRDPRRPA